MARKFLNEESYKEVRYKDLNEQDKKNLIAVYLGMCAEVDHNIGRILACLENRNLLESTLIVFTSDHGGVRENKFWANWDGGINLTEYL